MTILSQGTQASASLCMVMEKSKQGCTEYGVLDTTFRMFKMASIEVKLRIWSISSSGSPRSSCPFISGRVGYIAIGCVRA